MVTFVLKSRLYQVFIDQKCGCAQFQAQYIRKYEELGFDISARAVDPLKTHRITTLSK